MDPKQNKRKKRKNLFDAVTAYAHTHDLIKKNQTIIVGLSGGPDSVFLLYWLCSIQKEFNLTLTPVHLNHEWRTHSQKDVEFCSTLAKKLGLTLIHAKASDLVLTQKYNGSKEEYARHLRRSYFESIAREHGADVIALGHQLNDQMETFFIRLIRGATLSGLRSIQPKDGIYIHPLLCLRKEEIIAYLEEQNCAYLTDETNESDQFLRNRIRSSVMPALSAADSRFEQNMQRTINSLAETESFLTQVTQDTFAQICTKENETYLIAMDALFSLNPYLAKRVVLHWLIVERVLFQPSDSLLEEILRFLKNDRNKTHAIGTSFVIHKQKNYAFLKKQSLD